MSPQESYKLAAEVGCTPRTVRRWATDADSVAPATKWALSKACELLEVANPHATPDAADTLPSAAEGAS